MTRLALVLDIHRATHRIGLFIQRHARGLTQAEAHILCHLHEFPNSTVGDLHRAFAHKRSTLTSVLDRLEDRKLIRRNPSAKDRRSFVIRMTGAGKKRAASVHRRLELLEAAVLSKSRASLPAFQQIIGNLERTAAAE